MPKTSRISISLPTKLLNKFDDMLGDRRYRSRSNGIQDAMRDYIKDYESMNEIKGDIIGTLSVLHNHHYSSLMEDFSYIQDDYHKDINSVMHVYVTKVQSLEVIIVKGDIKYITNLLNKIMRLKGVEEVKLTTTLLDSK